MAKGSSKGALGCGMQAIKYFLFLVNFVFFFVGAALFGISIWVATKVPTFQDAFEDGKFGFAVAIPIMGIILGLFVLVGAFMGCMGAMKENSCMIKTFLAFLITTMLAEGCMVVVVIVYNTNADMEAKLDGYMKTPFELCGNKDSIATTCEWLPTVQKQLKCCGFGNETTTDFASQCSGKDAEHKEAAIELATNFCNKAILKWLKDHLAYVGGFLGGVFGVEILLIVGTCCLISGINGDNKYA